MEDARERIVYANCMRNLATNLPAVYYTTDGCGEFHEDGAGGMLCGACGCHRSFHRKVVEELPAVGGAAECGRRLRRPRTRFTGQQKARLEAFAQKLGWRMPGADGQGDDEVERFCRENGIGRRVFRTWLHNHKATHAVVPAVSAAITVPSVSPESGPGDGSIGAAADREETAMK
ncbi:ZF-HD homeobox protein [Apostasia shenzhenica]|uniref:ZF-HD homeobox protein n=1 Tax=Apostasia shenzhenica TaxID=1088818 RepID=A0A2I0A9H8_9ASPA|nr:ZF-HD homeobox protein [Apostasia shenzhenica]